MNGSLPDEHPQGTGLATGVYWTYQCPNGNSYECFFKLNTSEKMWICTFLQ